MRRESYERWESRRREDRGGSGREGAEGEGRCRATRASVNDLRCRTAAQELLSALHTGPVGGKENWSEHC